MQKQRQTDSERRADSLIRIQVISLVISSYQNIVDNNMLWSSYNQTLEFKLISQKLLHSPAVRDANQTVIVIKMQLHRNPDFILCIDQH